MFLVPLVVVELDHKGEAVVLHGQVGQYANLGALAVECSEGRCRREIIRGFSWPQNDDKGEGEQLHSKAHHIDEILVQ